MTIPVGNYVIEVSMTKEQGNTWIVHLFKKHFFFKRIVSSDWFLHEDQATTFAHQLADHLRNDNSVDIVKQRKPGWTLLRASR